MIPAIEQAVELLDDINQYLGSNGGWEQGVTYPSDAIRQGRGG